MDDPAAILRAQLDDDEQAARTAASANPGSPATRWSAEKVDYQDWRGWRKVWAVRPERVKGIDLAICPAEILPKVATHIARHDPARTLRDVAAMRKVLDCWPDPTGAWTAEQADAARAMKARILELLAEPYGQTPDA